MKKIIVFFLLGFFLFNIKFLAVDESYVRIEPVKEVKAEVKAKPKVKKVKSVKVRELTKEEEKEIGRVFGSNATKATAVFNHESGLRLDAQNWNCKYGKKTTSCKKEDRYLAVSVDCGISQKNTKGQTCPAELMTFEGSMKAAEKVYKAQGLSAWTSYTSGAYLKFM